MWAMLGNSLGGFGAFFVSIFFGRASALASTATDHTPEASIERLWIVLNPPWKFRISSSSKSQTKREERRQIIRN